MTASRIPADRFDWVGGAPALDFNNTVSWTSGALTDEQIDSYEALLTWAGAAQMLSPASVTGLRRVARRNPAAARRVLARAHRLRGALHQIFWAAAMGSRPEREALDLFETFLHQAAAHLRLAPSENQWTWQWKPDGRRLDQALWQVTWAAAELLSSPESALLKVCAGEDCGWVFLDRSRNQARRWCDMKTCGNTEKARRHYRRVKADADR